MERADTAWTELESFVLATSDLLLAVVGVGILCYPAVFLGNALLGAPLSGEVVPLVVLVLAVGGAYPFVAGDWSYGTLRTAVLAFVAGALVFDAVAGVAVLLADPGFAGDGPAVRAVAVAAAYGLAYLVAFRDGPRRGSTPESDVP